jgi:hypothetical protein
MASLFLPIWPLAGIFWYSSGGGWMAVSAVVESLILWVCLIYMRAIVALGLKISPWYALTTPLGAAVFGAMMITSAWRVISRKGITWKGRVYKPN